MKISKIFAIASAAVLMVACGGSAVEGSKEVRDLLPSKSLTDSTSYLIGVNFGSWIKGNDFGEINYNEMLKGMKDFINAKGNMQDSTFFDQFKVDPNQMNEVLDGYIQKRRAYTGALNKEKGENYIANFLKEDGAQQTESGLAYRIIEPGSEKKAVSDKDTVCGGLQGHQAGRHRVRPERQHQLHPGPRDQGLDRGHEARRRRRQGAARHPR